MKKLLLTLAFVLMTGVATEMTLEANSQKEPTVYVCTGPQSKRYHASSNCNGLNRCSGSVVEKTKSSAEKSGKTPCKICY